MLKKVNLCNPINYGGLRAGPVKYIVIHYTAGNGDTDENNAAYFARADTGKTSAHWFVDDDSATLSVPEDRVAYHCGAAVYYHSECRNSNSIGVELCSILRNGSYCFTDATLDNARELVRELMARYQVPIENVVRHYDVTHKICPAPFCGKGQQAWEEFKGGLIMYQKIENVPDWAKATVQKLVDRDLLLGDGSGNLNLSQDMTRILVILDRAGAFEK